jgi:hypothetical protein
MQWLHLFSTISNKIYVKFFKLFQTEPQIELQRSNTQKAAPTDQEPTKPRSTTNLTRRVAERTAANGGEDGGLAMERPPAWRWRRRQPTVVREAPWHRVWRRRRRWRGAGLAEEAHQGGVSRRGVSWRGESGFGGRAAARAGRI